MIMFLIVVRGFAISCDVRLLLLDVVRVECGARFGSYMWCEVLLLNVVRGCVS